MRENIMSAIWAGVYPHSVPSPIADRLVRNHDFISECTIVYKYVISLAGRTRFLIVLRQLENPSVLPASP